MIVVGLIPPSLQGRKRSYGAIPFLARRTSVDSSAPADSQEASVLRTRTFSCVAALRSTRTHIQEFITRGLLFNTWRMGRGHKETDERCTTTIRWKNKMNTYVTYYAVESLRELLPLMFYFLINKTFNSPFLLKYLCPAVPTSVFYFILVFC